MLAFTCNICGGFNQVEKLATEPASCACGSNVRLRALIYLLSTELFGRSVTLAHFPKLKAIRGLGMSDAHCYSGLLAEKLDYTNTFYNHEPRMDFMDEHADLHGLYDFILSADVIEHVQPPVERALDEVCRLLKPCGFLGLTIYCNTEDRMREHFPALHEFRIVRLGGQAVVVNRRQDGTIEVHDDAVFHGGEGLILEMREFGVTELHAKLLAAGFTDIRWLNEDIPEIGVIFDHDVSQPLIARKLPWQLDSCARTQLVEDWQAARRGEYDERQRADRLAEQIRLASTSRWVRWGRKFGVGPRFG